MADYGIGAADEISRLSICQPSEPEQQPPKMYSAGIVASDITKKFTDAVQSTCLAVGSNRQVIKGLTGSVVLEPGEVVKDGFFTLFDSVAALEIMDPKMDSGCIQPGEEFEVLYDVLRPLLPEEVLGIMDQLICHEMSWHLGYPLSQTLFTSVYVEALLMPEPGSIEDACFVRGRASELSQQPMLVVLRAYCLGMLKACGHVNERIKAEHFYEVSCPHESSSRGGTLTLILQEEDFVPTTYNRTLLTYFPSKVVQDLLTDAAELILTLKGSTVPADIADALISRLDLRSVFLAATESPQHVKEPLRAKDAWEKALQILPRIRCSHSLGRPVDDAFSPKLQRKLASTMPPRPIVKLGFDDAFGHLFRLFKDGSEVMNVLEYTDSQCLQASAPLSQPKEAEKGRKV
ncbi:hypothetical protein UVI_02001620 [Ustilaginoidea virens]|uniref:NAA35-like N-terminal domain-containing protein n=1 Tax=Ustilaginoidea virens TaxID=1159556 RepID=A0A1B5KTE5_USTVR|nr:hypothetical protein UVI_02001620 [Ustilaginoidea virens]